MEIGNTCAAHRIHWDAEGNQGSLNEHEPFLDARERPYGKVQTVFATKTEPGEQFGNWSYFTQRICRHCGCIYAEAS